MAKLEPITVTLSMVLGEANMPVDLVTFDLPLHTQSLSSTADTASFGINVNRTELRAQLARSTRLLADRVEASFLAPGAVLLTCEECGAELASQILASLRHEADGGHTVTPGDPQHPVSGPDVSDPSENPATSAGGGQSQGELSSLPDGENGGRPCACADREYEMTDVVTATVVSIDAAGHLDVKGKDAGAIAALIALANKIANSDAVLEHVLQQIREDPECKIRPPAPDNVSLSTYLKYSVSLGLTPGGRGELTADVNPGPAAPDELAEFRM